MGSVHFGYALGPGGFRRLVAIKRVHPQFAEDEAFVAMFMHEARLAAEISHPNVCAALDVVAESGDLFMVMDYVHGATLAELFRATLKTGERIPPAIAVGVMVGVPRGLQAAHEAVDIEGAHLNIVHRDVSPPNVLVGVDGVARLADFGVARSMASAAATRTGLVGKVGYLSPEQVAGESASAKSDLFAAATVLWELLSGERLFRVPNNDAATLERIRDAAPPPLLGLPALDDVLKRALARRPSARYATARDMANALEKCNVPASPDEVGAWVARVARVELATRAELSGEPSLRAHNAAIGGGVEPEAFETLTLRMEEPPPSRASLRTSGPGSKLTRA